MMVLTKKSPLTGIEHSMELPINEADIEAWRRSAVPIQRYFPHLDANQREFIMTGITPDEWDEFLKDEGDVNND